MFKVFIKSKKTKIRPEGGNSNFLVKWMSTSNLVFCPLPALVRKKCFQGLVLGFFELKSQSRGERAGRGVAIK